jgi:cytochrome c-type biogenesis protein
MDQYLLTVNQWMGGEAWLAGLGCFLWGVVSVLFSPCHLASIPLMVGYVAGQQEAVAPRRALQYALAFTGGLFVTIAALGVVCSLLGRMLGDIGPWWTVLVGVVLLWVALDMLGFSRLSLSGGLLQRLKFKGLAGALTLGLAYGVLSGTCTFGFIAPILALITVQERLASGMVMITLFGLGHCLPIAVAGTSMAAVRRVLENRSMQTGSRWFRRLAAVGVGALGLYFVGLPFFDS